MFSQTDKKFDTLFNIHVFSQNNKKTNDEVASKVTEELNKLKIAEEKDNKIVSREKPEMMSLNTLVEMCSAGEKPTKGKSEKDIRKKKAPVLVDDNQSYVMIGPPRFVFQYMKASGNSSITVNQWNHLQHCQLKHLKPTQSRNQQSSNHKIFKIIF